MQILKLCAHCGFPVITYFLAGFLPYSLDPLGFRSLAARNLLGSAGAGAGGFQVRFLHFLLVTYA